MERIGLSQIFKRTQLISKYSHQ